jgi:hypothetical protein
MDFEVASTVCCLIGFKSSIVSLSFVVFSGDYSIKTFL